MADAIQELMEELGPGAALRLCDPEWKAFGRDGETALGDTPIEALTTLRDKLVPRTPEQVVEESLYRCCKAGHPGVRHAEMANQLAAALRDAGMLNE